MDKQNIKNDLKSLIEQTYLIEQEYKNLSNSYENLQKIIKDVVDVLPTSIWVLNSDKTIFLQNSQASQNPEILQIINLDEKECEIEHKNAFYIIRINEKDEKKIISAVDITSQKRNERLASMGQVAAHLAHEIRNPIGSISLLTSTLLRKVDEKNKNIVCEIESAIWRVERIIKATLLFTKGLSLHKTKFSFLELKKECLECLKYYPYSKEISINLEFPDEFYEADKDLLSMVFQNLLFNAIDAIEDDDNESGLVELKYEKTDDEHKFYIFDSGVSIANKNAVFEPFKTSKLNGNGLGLSLCLQIINAHKGSIEVSLEPKNFCISFPIFK